MTRTASRREIARWERDCRSWAIDAARHLALALYHDWPQPVNPYGVGLVLERYERPLIETPMTFPAESPPLFGAGWTWTPPVRPWLLTSDRVAGRLSDGQISWWPWHLFVGCQIDLNAGREYIALDTLGGPAMVWAGPGVIPFALIAVFKMYGPRALVDHPGLAELRDCSRRS